MNCSTGVRAKSLMIGPNRLRMRLMMTSMRAISFWTTAVGSESGFFSGRSSTKVFTATKAFFSSYAVDARDAPRVARQSRLHRSDSQSPEDEEDGGKKRRLLA